MDLFQYSLVWLLTSLIPWELMDRGITILPRGSLYRAAHSMAVRRCESKRQQWRWKAVFLKIMCKYLCGSHMYKFKLNSSHVLQPTYKNKPSDPHYIQGEEIIQRDKYQNIMSGQRCFLLQSICDCFVWYRALACSSGRLGTHCVAKADWP